MQKWITNITKILRNPEYPQITGDLEKLNENSEIEGKCALGELRCQSGVKNYYNTTDERGVIMKKCGVPKWLYSRTNLPKFYDLRRNGNWVSFNKNLRLDFDDDVFFRKSNIQEWIYGLNDSGFTYDQICEWLEVTFGDL